MRTLHWGKVTCRTDLWGAWTRTTVRPPWWRWLRRLLRWPRWCRRMRHCGIRWRDAAEMGWALTGILSEGLVGPVPIHPGPAPILPNDLAVGRTHDARPGAKPDPE